MNEMHFQRIFHAVKKTYIFEAYCHPNRNCHGHQVLDGLPPLTRRTALVYVCTRPLQCDDNTFQRAVLSRSGGVKRAERTLFIDRKGIYSFKERKQVREIYRNGERIDSIVWKQAS